MILQKDRVGSDSEKLAMSTMGPLNPEQRTRGETLDEVCVGPRTDIQVHACCMTQMRIVLNQKRLCVDLVHEDD
jgi:hypothetical protein